MSKIENSAIASWSGFIYQGLCALHHCLQLIYNSKSCNPPKLFLNLDSYEDFSILDDEDNIVSLHQCKNKKNGSDYTDEFIKMIAKKHALSTKAASAKLYFHANIHKYKGSYVIVPPFKNDFIILYPFKGKEIPFPTSIFGNPFFVHSNNCCGPSDLAKQIEELVPKISNCDPNTCKKKCAELYKFIDDKVLTLHQKYISNKGKMRDIARKDKISFSVFFEILHKQEAVINLDKDSLAEYLKSTINCNLIENLNYEDDDCRKEKEEKIEFCLSKMNDLKGMNLFNLFQRLYPCYNLNSNKIETLANVTNDSITENLYKVLSDTPKLTDNLDWITPQKETPVALSSSNNKKICAQILGNAPNLDILYEYDWLVGNIPNTIKQIQLPNINQVSSANHNSIFQTKKVGILSIEDKNNENS